MARLVRAIHFSACPNWIARIKRAMTIGDYWRKILERRPDLAFAVERVFAGVDSIALEYRVGDLHGIEFMTLDGDGLITFAAGNDLA